MPLNVSILSIPFAIGAAVLAIAAARAEELVTDQAVEGFPEVVYTVRNGPDYGPLLVATTAYGRREHGGANAYAFMELTTFVLRHNGWNGLDAAARAALLQRWLGAGQMPGYVVERDEKSPGHGLAVRADGSDVVAHFWLDHVYESIAGPMKDVAKAPIDLRISPDAVAHWLGQASKP